jgi:hypothetical protein
MTDLERQFEQAMYGVYQNARKERICSGLDLLKMLQERGALQTARRLLGSPGASYRFDAFWEHGRLDLTIEAQVLRPEFIDLFTYEERQTARDRLSHFGYEV